MRKLWQLVILIFGLAIVVFAMAFLFLNSSNSISLPAKNIVQAPSFAPSPEISPKDKSTVINLVFVGDMMFDRYIRTQAKKQGDYSYILEDFKQIFGQADLIIANLEGPVTDFASKSVGSEIGSTNNYFFTFEPQVLKVLNDYGEFLLNLGNNHIFNFASEGLNQTLDNLAQAEIAYFAYLGQIDRQYSSIYYHSPENSDYTLAFINYNQFIEGGKEAALTDIDLAKAKADFLIVYPHWGIEYQTTANAAIQNLAHQFIDRGADLVIGSHPHVIQQSEVYKDKHIYYSLGNFVFDQYFDQQVKQGLLLEVKITLPLKKVEIKEQQVLMNKTGKTQLLLN